jgi:hypothetical protein
VTFFTVFLTVSLFILSIIPVFVGLAEDSKSYIVRSVTAIEQEAKAGFPILEKLPLNLDTLIRKQVDIGKLTQFITDENRVQLVMNNLVGNIDTIGDFIQK